ncbi:hypothetical protein C5167_048460 [Papaver somniferum]|uniref:XPG-I domain-containing protein n=1 Tax=Papaver somniferum TaxID=3469 RepID=A0A4Y7KKX9_PAPSO|nr:hypothetical protein C5167_048460 [Papaver somniferum]
MGVKNLWDILESCKKILPLHHLQNKRVCIDLSCWIVQLQNSSKNTASVKDKMYLRGLFHRLRALLALNCTIVFVADGSIPAIKLDTYRKRLGLVNEAGAKAKKVFPLARNMGSEFSCMIKEAKVLGMALGIPCLDSLEEAEAQCALLNSESLCDGCFSSDSDIFLFGAKTVYRDMCLSDGGHIVCYEMLDIQQKLGYGRNSLITLAILLGSDYSHGVRGFGPETACKIVKAVGDDIILQQIRLEGLPTKKTKGKKREKSQITNKENNLFHEQNITEQMSSTHFSAANFNKRVMVFLVGLLRKQKPELIPSLFPCKSDEYILPKIGERDLIRFSNLRSTLSVVGVQVPLNEMPVPCPISSIIKQRKVQGSDCYEVAWEHLDGLKTSVVSADLIEIACPERITEFQERETLRKNQKRKPRTKKSDKKAAMTELDLKLQALMLDIEADSRPVSSLSANGPPIEQKHNVPEVDSELQALLLDIEAESRPVSSVCRRPPAEERNTVPEVDLNLQALSVGIEAERRPISTVFSRRPQVEERNAVPEVDFKLQALRLDIEAENRPVSTVVCRRLPVKQRNVVPEVIDLLSPSPAVRVRQVSKYKQTFGSQIDVIDLCDSETDMCAVVTGGNKGIGFEICRQLASNGISVVLTARDVTKGLEAVEKLKTSFGLSNVVFHQLDMLNPTTISSLVEYVRRHFGKLDILVNNAGILGAITDATGFMVMAQALVEVDQNKVITETYESAEECIKTNYCGVKSVTRALIPLLQLSDSPRIVNVSSGMGQLKTDICYNTGFLTTTEGAERVVNLALEPDDGPSGLYFTNGEVTPF